MNMKIHVVVFLSIVCASFATDPGLPPRNLRGRPLVTRSISRRNLRKKNCRKKNRTKQEIAVRSSLMTGRPKKVKKCRKTCAKMYRGVTKKQCKQECNLGHYDIVGDTVVVRNVPAKVGSPKKVKVGRTNVSSELALCRDTCAVLYRGAAKKHCKRECNAGRYSIVLDGSNPRAVVVDTNPRTDYYPQGTTVVVNPNTAPRYSKFARENEYCDASFGIDACYGDLKCLGNAGVELRGVGTGVCVRGVVRNVPAADTTVIVQNERTMVLPDTGLWYIDWSISQCVQSCHLDEGVYCGGHAEKWKQMFATASACCETHLSWKDLSGCVPGLFV